MARENGDSVDKKKRYLIVCKRIVLFINVILGIALIYLMAVWQNRWLLLYWMLFLVLSNFIAAFFIYPKIGQFIDKKTKKKQYKVHHIFRAFPVAPAFRPGERCKTQTALAKINNTSMPYTKVMLHYIWATKNRLPIISKELKPVLLDHIKENSFKKEIHIDCLI